MRECESTGIQFVCHWHHTGNVWGSGTQIFPTLSVPADVVKLVFWVMECVSLPPSRFPRLQVPFALLSPAWRSGLTGILMTSNLKSLVLELSKWHLQSQEAAERIPDLAAAECCLGQQPCGLNGHICAMLSQSLFPCPLSCPKGSLHTQKLCTAVLHNVTCRCQHQLKS